jgi:hypothetical protein
MAKKRTGRPEQWAEDMVARFPAGTFARIDAVRREEENRTDFVREAVKRELRARNSRVEDDDEGSSRQRARTGTAK